MSEAPIELMLGARMKVRRARSHIAELKDHFERFVASKPYRVTPVSIDGEVKLDIRWDGLDPISGAILGDAIHNLRAALDLLACELARLNRQSDAKVYFPIGTSEERFKDLITSKNFNRAGEDAVAVLKTLRPYTGGNDALRALHELDIQDKHSLIIAMSKTARVQVTGTYDPADPVAGEFDITAEHSFEFPAGSALAGKEVIGSLEHLVEVVEGIIEAFTRLVIGRAAG